MGNNRLIIVDAFAQIYRGFYAIQNPLKNSQGQPTNALLMLTKFLIKLENNFPSNEGCFIFDCGKPQFRLDLAPDYKANRKPMPDELKQQLPHIEDIVSAFGWNKIRLENFEADDLIGAVAKKSECDEVLVITSDKDIHQIVDEKIKIMAPDTKQPSGFDIRGIVSVQQRFNIDPEQIVDYLAMIGDASDNIPGLAGVGPKTAEKLIKQFGSIANMIANSGEISNKKLRDKVDNNHDLLMKNITLVTLKIDVEDDFWQQENLTFRTTPDYKKLAQIFANLELKSVYRDLKKLAKDNDVILNDDDFTKKELTAPTVATSEKTKSNERSNENGDDLFNFSPKEKKVISKSIIKEETKDEHPDLFGF